MPLAPVVVVLLSRFNILVLKAPWVRIAFLGVLMSCGWVMNATAQNGYVASPSSLQQGANYLARIGQNNPAEIDQALSRIEQLFMIEAAGFQYEPVVIVLHGPEVAVFERQNYHQFKHIVHKAARLSAFNVVDIRVCETRLDTLGSAVNNLVPFVGTVPYGPAEIQRLTGEEGYLHF